MKKRINIQAASLWLVVAVVVVWPLAGSAIVATNINYRTINNDTVSDISVQPIKTDLATSSMRVVEPKNDEVEKISTSNLAKDLPSIDSTSTFESSANTNIQIERNQVEVRQTNSISSGAEAETSAGQELMRVGEDRSINPQPEPPKEISINELLVWTESLASGQAKVVDFDGKELEAGKLKSSLANKLVKVDGNLEIVDGQLKLSEGQGIDYKKIQSASIALPVLSVVLQNPSTTEKVVGELTLREQGAWLRLLPEDSTTTLGQLDIKNDFKIRGGELILTEAGNDYTLKLPPFNFSHIVNQLASITGDSLIGGELSLINAKPVYRAQFRERVRLFGLFPIATNVSLNYDGANGKFQEAEWAWWTVLALKTDYGKLIKTSTANLVVKDFKIEPTSYRAGEKIKITFKAYNDGLEYSDGGFTDSQKPRVALRVDGQLVNSMYMHLVIAPGSYNGGVLFYDPVVCNKEIEVVIDPDGFVHESNKDDNIYKIKTQCAPDNAPDLVGVSFYFDPYGSKQVGAKNKIKLVIKNQGNQTAPISQALVIAPPSQFLKLLSVPEIPAGQAREIEFEITPKDCTPIEVRLDSNRYFTEMNEDNNVMIEPQYVTDGCNSYADLQYKWVYWKLNGYSFGEPKADGEVMNFEVDVYNANEGSKNPMSCVNGTTISVDETGKKLFDAYVGPMGCPGYSTSNNYGPGHYIETSYFSYTAKCGEFLILRLDPDNKVWERNENNNFWFKKIECK